MIAFAVAAALLVPAAAADILVVPDDHATIQAAVDAAGPGDVVEIHKGVYAEAVAFSGKTGLTLRGKGKAVLRSTVDSISIEFSNCTDVDIEDLRFDGGGGAITFLSSDRVSVSECRFSDVRWAVDGRGKDTAESLSVSDCVLTDMPFGIFLSGDFISGAGPNSGRLSVQRCDLRSVGRGIDVQYGKPEVVDNDFLRVDQPITVRDIPAAVTGDGLVTGNRMIRCNAGIVAFHVSLASGAFRVSHNTLRRVEHHGIDVAIASALVIDDNDIRSVGLVAIATFSVSTSSTIISNSIRQTGSHGLYVGAGPGCTITDNVIDQAGLDGVYVLGDGAVLSGNSVTRADRRGILLYGSSCILTGNVAKGSGEVDLYENAPGTNTIAPDNNFGTTGP